MRGAALELTALGEGEGGSRNGPERTRSAWQTQEFLSLRASAGLLLRKGVSGERPGASRAEFMPAGPEKSLHQEARGDSACGAAVGSLRVTRPALQGTPPGSCL